MFQRILTNLEREQAKAYIAKDGEKTLNIRVLVQRARTHLGLIETDTQLLRQLVKAYDRNLQKSKRRHVKKDS